MVQSMTGFAAVSGKNRFHNWTVELRSVNGKGFDLKLRIPDWIDGLEASIRTRVKQLIKRGNVTLIMKLQGEETGHQSGSTINQDLLTSALVNIGKIDQQAMDQGITLTPSKATDLLLLKGILTTNDISQEEIQSLSSEILKSIEPLYSEFIRSRTLEGEQLLDILRAQLASLEDQLSKAKELLAERDAHMQALLKSQLETILDNTVQFDAQRMAQEVALIHVKSDVTEELDRLGVHIETARELLKAGGVVGRRMEFLMQEFNREANTLCSKAQYSELTGVGLEMKVIIDQMREQVQNLE